jgi:uncharacterized protein (TIGR03437 family)
VLTTQLDGTAVSFNGYAGYVTYASSGQVNVLVPNGSFQGGTLSVQINNQGLFSNPVTVPIISASPGIFTLDSSGTGAAIVTNPNGTINSASNPAHRGDEVAFWATGGGPAVPVLVDGQEPNAPFPRPQAHVTVTIDGIDFAGFVFAGVLQVNVNLPNEISTGEVKLILQIGNAASRNNVTIAVR